MSTIGDRVLGMLASGPKAISEIYEGVSAKRSSIDKACSRLVKSGEIERVDRGIYRRKRVIGGCRLGKISWEHLSEDEKSNYELNVIADVIVECAGLMDTVAYNQNVNVFQRLRSLVFLFESCASLAEGAHDALLSLETHYKEHPSPHVDVEAIFHGEGAQTASLEVLVPMLFELMGKENS